MKEEDRVLEGYVCDIYNRCSTTEEAQNRAIEVQAAESRELVLAMGGSIHRQYIEQESGTSTKKRNQYASLLTDVIMGKIDCIVIKSIDRLMRNAADWHQFIHLITANHVRLYLYLERKFYEPEDAFLSGIKALVAEQYSRELSQKVNNAHKRRQNMEKGRLTVTSAVFGYQKYGDEFVIDEKEAAFIRKMYIMSAEGAGSRKIAQELYAMGLRGRNGNAVSDVTIRRMIKNPLYMGMVVMNKTHYDFEQKKTIQNPPKEWIYHPNRVPQIVDQTLWQEANDALELRRKAAEGFTKISKKSQENNLFGKKLVCGICQSAFYRKKNNAGGHYWICGKKYRKMQESCSNIPVYEEELSMLLENYFTAYKEMEMQDWEEVTIKFMELFKEALSESDENGCKEEQRRQRLRLEQKKKALMNKLLEGVISDDDFKLLNQELEEKLSGLQKEKQSEKEKESRLERIKGILKGQEIKEEVQKRVLTAAIQAIYVKPEGRLEITFFEKEKTFIINYQHKNEKTRQKEEKIMQIYNCIVKCNTLTAAQIGEQVGLSANNVLQKTKELERQGKLQYVNRGSCGGYWKLTDSKDNFIKEK